MNCQKATIVSMSEKQMFLMLNPDGQDAEGVSVQ